ncbi:MAG: hypothetical protein PVF05_11570 [Gemmatimonadales bacterium]|jgi:cell shape-determining protein MreD
MTVTPGPTDLQRRDAVASLGVVALLLLLHFLLWPWLTGLTVGPDLLLGGLLLAALRVRAGTAAVLGFVLGPLEAAMGLGDPGTFALVLTLTGYLAARSRDVLFVDAPLFIAVYLFLGTWIARVALVLMAGGPTGVGAAIGWALLDALATALVCGGADTFASALVRRA